MPLVLGCCCSVIACLCSCLQIQYHLKLYFALVFALQKNNNICLGKKTCPPSLQFRELNTINFHGLPILENYLGLPFAGRGDSGGPLQWVSTQIPPSPLGSDLTSPAARCRRISHVEVPCEVTAVVS